VVLDRNMVTVERQQWNLNRYNIIHVCFTFFCATLCNAHVTHTPVFKVKLIYLYYNVHPLFMYVPISKYSETLYSLI